MPKEGNLVSSSIRIIDFLNNMADTAAAEFRVAGKVAIVTGAGSGQDNKRPSPKWG